VRDDVAALEQRQDGPHRRVILADMDHHRQVEGRGRLLSAPQCLEIVGAGHIRGQSRLDADHDIAVARDRAARQTHVG
jgi:hypothetical protein